MRWPALAVLAVTGALAAAGPRAAPSEESTGFDGVDTTEVGALAGIESVSVPSGDAPLAAATDVVLPRSGGVAAPAPRLAPRSLVQLPPSAVGAVVIDVDANRLFWFDNLGDTVDDGRELYVAIGKGGPEKVREGDEKTPIGIYSLSQFLEGRGLPSIYGAGAFTMNYPNPWDRRRGRTGSGIWIHGTDKSDEELLPRSSRGCLTVRNEDFLFLVEQLQLRSTPVIVRRGLEWRPVHETERFRRSLAERVERWRRDWESDTESYLAHYAEDFRSGSMDAAAWRSYKRRVNASKKFIEVELEDVAIYRYPGEEDLFLVGFEQRYRSDNFSSSRPKQLYWRQQSDGWRIVQES